MRGAKGQSLVGELDPEAITKTLSNQINKNKYFLKAIKTFFKLSYVDINTNHTAGYFGEEVGFNE